MNSGIAQQCLTDIEKQSHVSFMKIEFNVDTEFHGYDEISYNGSLPNVKQAILNHYDGDVESAKQLHPALFQCDKETIIDQFNDGELDESYASWLMNHADVPIPNGDALLHLMERNCLMNEFIDFVMSQYDRS